MNLSNKFIPITIIVALIATLMACQPKVQTESQDLRREQVREGVINPMYFTEANLEWYTTGYADHSPDPESIEFIRNNAEDLHIEAFIGTWCPYSRAEFPKLMKVIDEGGIPRDNLLIIGVPHQGGIMHSQAIERQIKGVPTFIFVYRGREIGRVNQAFDSAPEVYIANLFSNMIGGDR